MLNKFFNSFNINNLYILLIFIFTFFINKHYASLGVFPIDTFLHFDSGYGILNNEHPIKDYWVVSGIFVDYLGAIFFYFLGSNWNAHTIHASLLNSAISIFTYILLTKLNLKKTFSFIYAIFFGILAYTPSGTPFLDHHSMFFSLAGAYFFILALKFDKIYFWIIFPWFFAFSFLSKQVPSSYLIILTSMLLISYSILIKKYKPLILTFVSTIFIFLFFIIFCLYIGIDLNSFFQQYILYPQSIGSDRINSIFAVNIESIFNKYKYLILPILCLSFVSKKLFIEFRYNNKIKNFFIFLTFISIAISFIFHQILTKNQIYIYFLIPLLFSFFTICLNEISIRNKNYFILIALLVTLLITGKYHIRYNEERKLHELENVSFKKAVNAKNISSKLNGLKWITPNFKDNPEVEIKKLKNIYEILLKDKNKKILITHYSFFSTILGENINSFTRTYTMDGASFPVLDNKYYSNYKKHIEKKIKSRRIKYIYFIKFEEIDVRVITDYLDKNCFNIEEDIYFKKFIVDQNCF